MNKELLDKIQTACPNPSLTLPDAITRYLAGESMQILAKELGVCRATLYKWMFRQSGPDEWKELKKDALITRIAQADDRLEEASDAIDITRAREQARFARMDYERLCSKEYGPKQEIDVDNKITVIVQRQPIVVETPRNIAPASQPIDVIPEKIMDNSPIP